MSKSSPVISVKDLEIHFDQSQRFFESFKEAKKVRAVNDVSLEIQEKEVLALVGESGCGKTTLGKAIVGLQRPTGGRVMYKGRDIWEKKGWLKKGNISQGEIRKSLQIIHQDPGGALNPNRKVISQLENPLKQWYSELSKEDRRARILGMLEHVGMAPPEDYASRFPHQLSGGEQQRVVLVRSLLMNPDLILADEAISALDVSLRIEMMELLLDLQDEFNTSFVFISHDISNARYLAEKSDGRIGIMYLGEIVEIGKPEQIIKNPQHPYTKSLLWATPDLVTESDGDSEIPLKKIDVPDPVDPPSGCTFHPRCPEAREICSKQEPESIKLEDRHFASCYRANDNHKYWKDDSIN